MRCDDSGTLKPRLGWIGAWGTLKGENVMFWSEAKVPSTGGHDVTAFGTRTRMKAAIPDCTCHCELFLYQNVYKRIEGNKVLIGHVA